MSTKINEEEIIGFPFELTNECICQDYNEETESFTYTVKDVNDAVKNWGRLATTMSILEYRTKSRIKMEMTRRKLT
jgi:hypothetical protein